VTVAPEVTLRARAALALQRGIDPASRQRRSEAAGSGARRGGHERGLRRRWRQWVVLVSVVALGATTLAACGGGPPSYTVKALFANAGGLYAGNTVEVLGVPSGTVTDVATRGNVVVVTMQIDGGRRLPAAVGATLTTPEILGTPDVELYPGYTGGPRLAPRSTIPESRTVVPVSINRLLVDLQQVLGKISPRSVGGAVTALSQDLAGQGQALHQLIGQGAGTLQLLANKGSDLGRLDGSLAAITGTLRQQTSQLTSLLQDYNTVAGVLDANRQPLGQAIDELDAMSADLAAVLAPNLHPLQQDIATITQVGRTLARNLPTLDQTLVASNSLFAATARGYDATHNWLNLNLQLAPGVAAADEAGQVRDLLAGICRRLAANHASSFTASELKTLETCGNPNSGYFDPILGLVPQLLYGQGSSSAVAPSAQQMLSSGLSAIPGLSPAQRQAIGSLSPSQLPSSPSATTGSTRSSGSGSSAAGNEAAGSSSSGLHPAAPKPVPSSSGGLLGGLLQGLTGVISTFGRLW
jgi:virulence factor Mce-like protein